MNKKCSEIWYCQGLSLKEKGEAALAICAALESLEGTVCCPEIAYYLAGFAAGMARKLGGAGGDGKALETAEKLRRIGEDAMAHFEEYSETDPVAKEVLAYDFLDFP